MVLAAMGAFTGLLTTLLWIATYHKPFIATVLNNEQ